MRLYVIEKQEKSCGGKLLWACVYWKAKLSEPKQDKPRETERRSMLICLFVITFFVIVLTGPAGIEWRDKRKALKNQPLAKLLPFPYPPNHPRKI